LSCAFPPIANKKTSPRATLRNNNIPARTAFTYSNLKALPIMVARNSNSEDAMKLSRVALLLVTAACLFATGCASHPYAVAPAPYASAPPLIERAEHQGFRAGSENGSRDLYNNFGHHPERDRSFHDTPGYDPAMGPYAPYRDAFRRAYVRGYDQAFYRR
jgi:hypothetical protein